MADLSLELFGRYSAVLRRWGVRRGVPRAIYELRKRTHALERATPVGIWDTAEDPGPLRWDRFFIDASRVALVRERCAGRAVDLDVLHELAAGRLRFFNGAEALPVGNPPDFLINVSSGRHHRAERHWSRSAHRGAEDIKVLWEPSRFCWAYDLARGAVHTGRRDLPELFWQWFEAWCRQNPPNAGPNWSCGQEASIRLFAVVFAAAVFADADATTAARSSLLQQFVLASGRRIEANIGYARLQRNNHYSSEAAGLFTAAVLCGDTPWGAAAVARAGEHLARAADELIGEDGSSTQDSLNYHRVLLHGLCWAVAVSRSAGHPLPARLHAKLRAALGYLEVMTDRTRAGSPLFGANDGALVLPLSNAAFNDFGPVIEMTRAALGDPSGAEEGALWLFGAELLPPRGAPAETGHSLAGRTSAWHANGWDVWLRSPTRSSAGNRDENALLVSADGHPVVTTRGTWSYHGADAAIRAHASAPNAWSGARSLSRTVRVGAGGVAARDVVDPSGRGAQLALVLVDLDAHTEGQRVILPTAGVEISFRLEPPDLSAQLDLVPAQRYPTYRNAVDAVDAVLRVETDRPFRCVTRFARLEKAVVPVRPEATLDGT